MSVSALLGDSMSVFLSILLVAAQASTAPFYGIAVARDGDSLTIDGRQVRLFGIDAPEFGQTCTRSNQSWNCGEAAAEQLSKLATGREVRCVPIGTDQYDRILARCTAGVTDINRTMVASGHAVAFRRYSSDYVSAEESAKANRRGIWSGTFQMPHLYRGETEGEARTPRRQERPVPTTGHPAPRTGACNIKGNRSRRGDWIYHVPGMPYYAQTRAEEMFCSEADARAAGYRRARVR